jgi:GLPGLI family protein
MKNILITLTCLLFSAGASFAQHATFTSSGTIEYQKSSNMYALMKKAYSASNTGGLTTIYQQIIDQYQKTQPQFKVLKSTLAFGNNKTLFTPIVPDVPPNNSFNTPMSDQINTVYTDLNTQTSVVQKTISDAIFLVKDSVRKMVWKITNDTREIAGYPCRRANGLVLDSIYVVAFYTDKIAVSGGPESFSGLPGMILLLQMPNEHITWTATKVTGTEIPPATLVPPKKGNAVNNKQLYETLKGIVGGRADAAQLASSLKPFLL